MPRFGLFIFVVFVSSCASHERNHPEEYIKVLAEPWEGETVLDVEIINTARYTDYGNIAVLIQYVANGRKVGTERLIHYDVIVANSNSVLNAKIHPPENPNQADEITLSVDGVQIASHLRE